MIAQHGSLAGSRVEPKASTRQRHRLLGTMGMVASPFLFLSFAGVGFSQDEVNRLASFFGLIFAVGWLASVLGLRELGVAGQRTAARALLTIMAVTVAIANIVQVFEIVSPGVDSTLYAVLDVCWPLSMLLLLITGVASIRARVFDGWLRFTPLIAALWLPLGIAWMGLLGTSAGQAVAGIHVAFGWFLMGYAVRKGGRLAG
jgi:hypothetical protein